MKIKEELVWTVDYTNVLIGDICIIIGLLILSWRWKEQRLLMFVGASLYSFFTVMWHWPPGIINY